MSNRKYQCNVRLDQELLDLLAEYNHVHFADELPISAIIRIILNQRFGSNGVPKHENEAE